MSLLTKAKVITTPTAYSDGFLHSVKPNVVLGDELDVFPNSQNGQDTYYFTPYGTTNISYVNNETIIEYVDSNNGGYHYLTTAYNMSEPIVVGKTYILEVVSKINSGSYGFQLFNNSYISFASGLTNTDFETIQYEFTALRADPFVRLSQFDSGEIVTIQKVSIKEKIDADFTFTRNSSATRVGEDGYIQDVQIIGGELVQNGDFEEIGSNVIVQGDWLDPDSAAEFYDNKIKINAGVNGSTNRIRQTGVIDSGKTYQYTYEVLENNGVTNLRYYNGSTYVNAPNTVGVHIIYYTHTGSNLDFFIRVNDTTLGNYIVLRDNVSVKEVGQNWTVSNSDSTHYVEFSEDGARFVSDTTSPILTLGQGISLTSGNKYRFSIRLRNNGGTGNIKVQATGLEFMPNILDGTYTQDIIPTTNQSAVSFYRNGSDVDLYIEDFSIKEVTDDTNLPRINYEGFTYAESLGDNVVVNGTFDTDSDWSKTNAVISGGVATITSTGYAYAAIVQNNVLTIGKRYKATIDVKSITGGIIIGASDTITSSGIISEYFTATQTYLEVRRDSAYATTIATIDNVSVQEVIGDLPVPYSGKGHLLLEPQRSNLITYSEDFELSDWSKTNITIDNNISISPDGNVNASRVNSTTTASGSYAIFNSSNVSGALSYFAKDSGGRYFVVIRGPYANNDYAIFDLENGVISKNPTYSGSTAEIENYGNGWYRCILYSAQLATVNAFSTSGSGTSLTVLASGTIDIYGAQLEQNATYATSYIPTNGTTVTRLGETCNNATQSFPSEGVLYAEIAALADDGTNRSISISDGTLANRVTLFYTSSSNRIRVIVKENNITSFDEEYQVSSTLDFHKCAARYKDNDYSLWIDGVEVFTDTSGVAPSGLNELMFNKGDNVSLPFYGKTKMVATFPYLSNDEMECLTGEGYGSFQAMALANNYTII